MNISVAWLNRYLEPGNLTADEAEQALMGAGFPIESREQVVGWDGSPDTRLDVEITSNRGDCLSHVGLAREVAAKTGRSLKLFAVAAGTHGVPAVGGLSAAHARLENRRHDVCPLFTVRVIKGVTIGPSPAWLSKALESVGQRSINNVVDVTNFINFELGHPSHAFDLARLKGGTLVVRGANAGEKLTTLDGKVRELVADDIVVADAERAQSLAGVIGGAEAEVSAQTRDIAFEMATWEPGAVRRMARRHGVRTDASYRFERGVDAREIEAASRRAAEMIVAVAGGTLCDGVIADGRPLPEQFKIHYRPGRASALIGVDVPAQEQARILRSLSIAVDESQGGFVCVPPAWRLDLTREVDLIEEVARIRGLEAVPQSDRVSVAVAAPQKKERAMRELSSALAGLGFFETVTFSFIRPAQAPAFLPPGLAMIGVDDDRRGAEPTLRPSILPSLLACRRANQDGQVSVDGGIRLYEIASVFAQHASKDASPSARADVWERRRLCLLADGAAGNAPEHMQASARLIAGAVSGLVTAVAGPAASVVLTPGEGGEAYYAGAAATVTVNGVMLGVAGLVAPGLVAEYGLEIPVVAAELDLEPLLAMYPGRSVVTALPEFPAAERDLSLLVPEGVTWARLSELVHRAGLHQFESLAFVGTYRGKQTGAGRKSVTMRLRFRDPAKTLRREEVDPQIETLVAMAKAELNAEFRA